MSLPTIRQSILTEAESLVHGSRNLAYGHPLDDFERTAKMLSAILADKLLTPIEPEEVGLIMCCVKLSRQVNKPKRDNMVDLAGYAETVQWTIDEIARRKKPQGASLNDVMDAMKTTDIKTVSLPKINL